MGKGNPWYQQPLTEQDITGKADARVAAILAALAAPITSQRAAAAKRAQAQADAILGTGKAAAELMTPLGPQIQQGYRDAALDMSELGKGFSAQAAGALRAGQDANKEYVEKMAPGSTPQPSVNPTDLQDVLYASAYQPAASLEAQGASANRWASVLPAIAESQTRVQHEKAIAEANAKDEEYVNQLLDLAAKRPELTNQVIDQLYQIEISKAGVRQNEQQFSYTKKKDRRDYLLSEADRKTNATGFLYTVKNGRVVKATDKKGRPIATVAGRAETANEQALGLEQKKFKHQTWLDRQEIKLSNRKQKDDVAQAIQDGAQPDPTLSKAYGYIVDSYGNPIRDARGKKIPVAKSSRSGSVPQKVKNYQEAVGSAKELKGEPVEYEKAGKRDFQNNGQVYGKYLARPGVKGVLPTSPPTTNNPRLAKTDADMSFAEAQNFLMQKYGLSRAKARSALVAAGWKPDGRRPRNSRGTEAPGHTP